MKKVKFIFVVRFVNPAWQLSIRKIFFTGHVATLRASHHTEIFVYTFLNNAVKFRGEPCTLSVSSKLCITMPKVENYKLYFRILSTDYFQQHVVTKFFQKWGKWRKDWMHSALCIATMSCLHHHLQTVRELGERSVLMYLALVHQFQCAIYRESGASALWWLQTIAQKYRSQHWYKLRARSSNCNWRFRHDKS